MWRLAVTFLVGMSITLSGCGGGSGGGSSSDGGNKAPVVASQFTAHYSGVNLQEANLTLYYDAENNKMKFISKIALQAGGVEVEWGTVHDFAKDAAIHYNMTQILPEFSNTSFCYPNSRFDWDDAKMVYGFGWLKDATLQDEKASVAGKNCKLYTHKVEGKYEWSACIGDANIPVSFKISNDAKQVGPTIKPYYDMDMTLLSANIGQPAPADFEQTTACSSWPQPVCSPSEVTRYNVYRATGFVLPTPAEQNANDARAAIYFICSAGQSVQVNLSALAVYDMSMSTAYGQFEMCNYVENDGKSYCMGQPADWKNVGRGQGSKTSMNLPDGGQCLDDLTIPVNALMGKWLSFNSIGDCGENDVGTDGCTWKVESYRTVEPRCILEDQGYQDLCVLFMTSALPDPVTPFEQAVAACPDITPRPDVRDAVAV